MTSKAIFFFERNSFALRQELHPGWVNKIKFSAAGIFDSMS
jgi:hypothetical protein